ncbi:MAG: flavodoxin family protein [Abditibacteriota bacterium]|nr:flavodoxin family protein [Abditibacteriota bacterium]
MKTVIINASPRKTWNTAQLLKEAQRGAEAAGAETEYIDLYDLAFSGCRSCLSCKRKGARRCRCYFKDDLSPVIDRILAADAVIFGTPIYMGEPSAGFRALFERLGFCILSYDEGERSYFDGKINTGFIYTMNAPDGYYETNLRPKLEGTEEFFRSFLKGKVLTMAACGTLQTDDYSRYSMGMFNEAQRKESRKTRFPADLEKAFDMGYALSR